MPTFACPSCQNRVDVPKNCLAGQKANCPRCHRQVIIPRRSPLFWLTIWLLAPGSCFLLGIARGRPEAAFFGAALGFLATAFILGSLWALDAVWSALFRLAGGADED
jgi:uncharacterized paraquat-inducible protein A